MSIRPVRDVPTRGASQPKESIVAKEMGEFAVPHMDGGYCAWGIRKEQR